MTKSQDGHIWNAPMVQGNMPRPVVLVFAGPNWAGKSTIARSIPHNGVYKKKMSGGVSITQVIFGLLKS